MFASSGCSSARPVHATRRESEGDSDEGPPRFQAALTRQTECYAGAGLKFTYGTARTGPFDGVVERPGSADFAGRQGVVVVVGVAHSAGDDFLEQTFEACDSAGSSY